MSKKKTSSERIKGIYRRGNVWWFTKRVNGKKCFWSLGTDDYGKAVLAAHEILQSPELAPGNPFDEEVEAFLIYKQDRNRFTSDSVSSKRYILGEFSRFVGGKSPTAISVADCYRYYEHKRKTVAPSTAQGYLFTLRSFFRYLVEVKQSMRTTLERAILGDRADGESSSPLKFG